MKITRLLCSWLALSLVAGAGLDSAVAKDKGKEDGEKSEAKTGAKISKDKAAQIALGVFKVKTAVLEKENGKLIWSFDIKAPETKNVFEVQVDAKSGKIVSVAIEKPSEQAKEAQQDKKQKVKKSEKDQGDAKDAQASEKEGKKQTEGKKETKKEGSKEGKKVTKKETSKESGKATKKFAKGGDEDGEK